MSLGVLVILNSLAVGIIFINKKNNQLDYYSEKTWAVKI